MPASTVDGNSPGFWQNGELTVFTSTGYPSSMKGPSLSQLSVSAPPIVYPATHYPLWIESVWLDQETGLVYGWYHHEARICGDKLALPEIGALVSKDGGLTFEDLGVVLSSGEPFNCSAQNGFFGGGHGDFSVVLDQTGQYFYFFFTNYAGPAQNQGISIARMSFADRESPLGNVWKFHQSEWTSPGVGGPVTPIFPVQVSWQQSNTDSFWGPAVHWNTAIGKYVMLLNHACCKSGWPQEGIYAAIASDITEPSSWSTPKKILDDSEIGFAPGYYPQAFGLEPGETDTIAGINPRLFIKGVSKWELVFENADENRSPGGDPDPCQDRARFAIGNSDCGGFTKRPMK